MGVGWLNLPNEDTVDLAVLIGREQRIDALAFHTWPSQRYRRIVYEVKISRGDLRRELNQPHKQDAALALSNLFYLAVPSGLDITGFDLPAAWGVIAVSDGKTQIIRTAPWRETSLPSYGFMLSLARNL